MQRIVGDRYSLVRPLGRGGMGEVWLGRDTRLDRDVAVKLLRPSSLPAGADVEALINRFAREARLTAKLENPGVPAVYDTGQDEDDLFLVMQVIGGADLAEFQAENEPVPVGWVVAIGAQIASVLGAAHGAGLIHRDLKPRNVMITENGEIKVLDFGIAVLRDVDMTRITRTSEAVGTPAYMAPEQAMHGQFSPSSDLYSLGCVLYELLTGKYVFDAQTPLAMMHRHFADTPEPVLSLRPDAGPRLADLVARLLAKKPEARPADAREVYDTLLPLLPPPVHNGARIPMDPTRPFRDQLAVPQRPERSLSVQAGPVDPPTMPVLRPVTPAPTLITPPPMAQPFTNPPFVTPQPMPAGVPTPVPMAPIDTPGKRMWEGTLLSIGFTVLAVLAAEMVGRKSVPDPAATISIGVILLFFGLRMRQRRMQLRYFFSIGGFRKPPRLTSRTERILERVLLIIGAMMFLVYTISTIIYLNGGTWDFTSTTPASGIIFSLAALIPGVLMRQHRLGKPYPWTP
ncbi:serine/threonine protein kinase [Kibdelosporangium banguiense]|uniref:non-specific serine/threonine protein kinase n=1 Tax=Kibdelosporangium banguiense TaxID=1365924 RepID=A0ABS4TZM4_9PSEU|nr:serine/threonine-protein kinase [Kibdelosporangium banguiense]MBP2329826.1 serine/threonine protein kinase [Kibdelosporangium banguiense]